MASVKKTISAMFDFIGDFKEDPPAAIMMCLFLLIATFWWFVFVLPIQIPLSALKDWSKHNDKSLWRAYKDNFRGPVQ